MVCTHCALVFGPLLSNLPSSAASFGAHPAVVALLLLKGANSSLVNSAGLSARQEARGDARFVYQLFEEGMYL